MTKPFLGVRIADDLNNALLARMAETGLSKSEIVIAALHAYLGSSPCHHRLDAIERRLSDVESQIAQTSKLS